MGRLIGMAFAFLAVYFGFEVFRLFRNKIIALFFLGGLQGVVGWYGRGLVDRPDVSHYRLTTHLGLAVFLYIALLWTALRHRVGTFDITWQNGAKSSSILLGMVYLTLLSGDWYGRMQVLDTIHFH